MDFALQPSTTSGSRFVELAEKHATDFAVRASQHDQEGSFPFENIASMQQSGVMGACVPLELGGLGVESLHDAMLGINRLGRGDGSTAIGTAMHVLTAWVITRGWRSATAAGDTPVAERMALLLRQIAAGEIVLCSPQSEPGTDMLHPLVEATKVTNGWHLNGRKIFGTLSPAATLFAINCRAGDQENSYRRVTAMIPAGTPGMDVKSTGTPSACGVQAVTTSCSRTASYRRQPCGRTVPGGNGRSARCRVSWRSTWHWSEPSSASPRPRAILPSRRSPPAGADQLAARRPNAQRYST